MFPEGSEPGRGLPGRVDLSTRESRPLTLRFRKALSCQDSAESLIKTIERRRRRASAREEKGVRRWVRRHERPMDA